MLRIRYKVFNPFEEVGTQNYFGSMSNPVGKDEYQLVDKTLTHRLMNGVRD